MIISGAFSSAGVSNVEESKADNSYSLINHFKDLPHQRILIPRSNLGMDLRGVLNVVHGDKVAVDAILTHPDIAAVSFVALLGAAGFRSVPGVMMNPLHQEFGWSHGTVGLAMSVNMMLFGPGVNRVAMASA